MPAPFLIGRQRNVTATRSGALLLAVNDTVFDDNEGQYRVAVHVAPPPLRACRTRPPSVSPRTVSVSRHPGGPRRGRRASAGSSPPKPPSRDWFFSSTKWELLVNVLNGCSANNRYWVFAAATTKRPIHRAGDRHQNRNCQGVRPRAGCAGALGDGHQRVCDLSLMKSSRRRLSNQTGRAE